VFSFHAHCLNSLEAARSPPTTTSWRQDPVDENLGSQITMKWFNGKNGKMNEISAAMGLTSWRALDEITAANKRNYFQYRKRLAGIPSITCCPAPAERGTTSTSY
jgi:dTDP-4-amino-4,6-dideoxygalactose transaminase